MDDQQAQGHAEGADEAHAEEGQTELEPDREVELEPDREEAATLAEMATALAEASAPPTDETAPPATDEAGPIAPKPSAGGRAGPRRWVGARSGTLVRYRRYGQRAVALGLAGALVLASGGSAAPRSGFVPSSSSDPSAIASHRSPSAVSASPSAAGSPAGSPVATASKAGPTATPSEEPIPSSTSPEATITFRQLLLDGSTDPAGAERSFSFVSDGPGTVSAEIDQSSPLDSTTLCVAVDSAGPRCATGATPGVTVGVATAHSRWTVTLASAYESSPTVDVTLSWRTDHPSMALSNCLFQGYPNPDSVRTLMADFTTRGAGNLSVDAAWSRTSVAATLTLADLSGANPVTLGTAAYTGKTSISPAYTHPVVGGRTYEVTLYNNGSDTGRTVLTATVAFP